MARKFLKALGLIIAYLAIYYFFQVLTMAVFVLLTPGLELSAQDLAEHIAVNAAGYIAENTGMIMIMSASLSFSAFAVIYLLRGKNILTVCNLTNSVPVKTITRGCMFGLSANFIVSFMLAILMQFKYFESVFEQYESLVSFMMNPRKAQRVMNTNCLKAS